MKIRHILILALAACTVTAATAQKKSGKSKKAKTEKTVKTTKMTPAKVQPVPAAEFSYAIGVGQSQSLKTYLIQREGVDSAYIEYTAQALKEAAKMSPEELKQKMAYAAGLRIAQMNTDQVIKQFNDTHSADSALKVAERQFEYYKQKLQQENADFLVKNAKEKGVKTTPSGLQYRILTQGKGTVAADTTEVQVHYEGRLIDGTVFDSSYKRGQPATFRPNQVIKGWTEALTTLPEGTVAELYIPYNLAYGERGNQNIPPYATLIFKLEILKVGDPEAGK